MRGAGWLVGVAACVGVAGCADPAVGPGVWWRIEVGTAVVGTDHHVTGADGGLVSSRTYRYRAGDRTVVHEARSRWRVVDGRVFAHASDTVDVAFPEAQAPWWWLAPPPIGATAVYDPATGGVLTGPVLGDGEGRRLGSWWAELGDDGVVAYGAGPVRVVRVAEPPPSWESVDPAVRLGWATGPLAGRRRVALAIDGVDPAWLVRPRQRVEDGQLVVEVPLRAEVPAATLATIADAVIRVQARLDYAPTPGGDALAFGVRGDCTEFASAFVTAIDLPARPVVGWVHVDRDGGVFVPHAWAEVDTGAPSGWVPVDPTLGQVIADAGHVGLSERWAERPWDALLAAAGAQVRVVESRD